MKTHMMMSVLVLVCCAMPLAVPAADPPTPDPHAAAVGSKPAPAEAQIPFANHGGIYTWQVLDDKTLLVQSQSRKWYRATLMSPCFDLPFTEKLGFQTNADGSFDKFGAVTVRGQRCPLVSLVESPPPPKKAKKGEAGQKVAPPATTHTEKGSAPK